MKKILISLSAIAIVAAVAIGATVAYFSDTETSSGNTFTAGTIDLQVGSQATYNGQAATYGNWDLRNLGQGDLLFSLNDVKPGDIGENTITLHLNGNPACGFVDITKGADLENGCNEPEIADEPACLDDTIGELSQNVNFTIWADTDGDNVLDVAVAATPGTCTGNDPICGIGNGSQEFCEQVQGDFPQAGCIWTPGTSAVPAETVLVSGNLNGNKQWAIGELPVDTDTHYGVAWTIPGSVNNIIQSDSFTGDVSFRAEQKRNQYDNVELYPNGCPVGEVRSDT